MQLRGFLVLVMQFLSGSLVLLSDICSNTPRIHLLLWIKYSSLYCNFNINYIFRQVLQVDGRTGINKETLLWNLISSSINWTASIRSPSWNFSSARLKDGWLRINSMRPKSWKTIVKWIKVHSLTWRKKFKLFGRMGVKGDLIQFD